VLRLNTDVLSCPRERNLTPRVWDSAVPSGKAHPIRSASLRCSSTPRPEAPGKLVFLLGCSNRRIALVAFLSVQVGVNPRTREVLVLLSRLVRPRPIVLGIPPQPGERVRESGWPLGRGERLAKFVQGQGAIFSKYADTNDDVLLYAKVASPFVNR